MVPQLALNGILLGASYVLLALGFALSKREVGFFDFSYALQFTLGAYLVHSFYSASIPPLPAGVLACLGTAFLGATMQRVLYARLAHAGLDSLGLLIVSLAVYGAGQNLVALVWGDARLAFRPPSIRGTFALGPVVAARSQIVGFSFACLLVILLILVLRKTAFGRGFRAVADDRDLATLCGLPVERYKVYTQGIAGVLAGLAGIVFALDTGIEPRMGFRALLVAVVAVVAGGGGNLGGTAIAALGLGLAQQLSAVVISTRWQDAIAVLVLAVALVFRPAGLAWRRL